MSDGTVAAVVADGLARAGVARVFAAPGAAEVMVAAVRAAGLAVVDVSSATAACIMAAATAEVTSVPGAALVSLQDLTVVVGGLAHASRDRAPVVVVSDGAADGRLLEPVTRCSVQVEAPTAAQRVAQALAAATGEPAGGVHLAVTTAVALQPATMPGTTVYRRAQLPPPPPPALDALAGAIAAASRPLLVAGLQVAEADAPWFRALAQALPAPLLATPKGKGALPDPHPLALGPLRRDHPLAGRPDLVVAFGVDAVELTPGDWPAGAPVAHVGRAPADGVLYRPVVEVVGEIGLVIEELAPRLRDRERANWDMNELDRAKRVTGAWAPAGPGLSRRRVIEIVREAMPVGTRAALDVPLPEAWPSVAPRELLVPNGVATPGFALPAALAVALARGDRRVVAIAAAPGLVMAPGDLVTAARLGLPVIVVALNQAGAIDVRSPAEAAGISVRTAADETEVVAAVETAWAAVGPMLVDAHVLR